MDASELIAILFPDNNYGTRVPADVESQWQSVDGVYVRYFTAADARDFWGKSLPDFNTGRVRHNMAMRAVARCPHAGCGRLVAASRINQHARVHAEQPAQPIPAQPVVAQS